MVSAPNLTSEINSDMLSKPTPEDFDKSLEFTIVTPDIQKPSKIQAKDIKNDEVAEIVSQQVPDFIKSTIGEDQGDSEF